MSAEPRVIIEEILDAIEKDKLVLPTLPEVAIKIQELIDDPNVSAEQIVVLLTGDPLISAQLIKSANSVLFIGKQPVESVRSAITRLGYRQLRNLVMFVTMNKMFYAKNSLINNKMKLVWKNSRELAAVSYVLASHQSHLSPDQAMLAGLIHDIGVLPLCLYIEKHHSKIGEETLSELIQSCSNIIGTKLLQKWNFPPDMVQVAGEYNNLQRESSLAPLADYTDVVAIAKLQDPLGTKEVAWNTIAAVQRLGLSEEDCRNFLENFSERISLVAEMLGISRLSTPKNAGLVSSIPDLPSPHKKSLSQNSRNSQGLFSKIMSLLTFWK
ncbi:MAG: HDOD domain-containing protein [Gallionellaceae bacterium]|jgi:HD-like signal output (HDOD) protein